MKAWFLGVAQLAFMAIAASGEPIPADLLRGLSSERFAEREESEQKLLDWVAGRGDEEVKAVYALAVDSDDPEVRRRCGEILRELSDRDYLTEGKGYVGIIMAEERIALADEEKPRFGIRIQHVVDNSPASEAGVRRNDLVVALDGKKWHDEGAMEDFMAKVAEMKPLQEVVLTVVRADAEPIELTVRLGRRPVEELGGFGTDLEALDKQAKEKHFGKWLAGKGLRRW